MLCICKVQILMCVSLQEHSYAYLFTYSLVAFVLNGKLWQRPEKSKSI